MSKFRPKAEECPLEPRAGLKPVIICWIICGQVGTVAAFSISLSQTHMEVMGLCGLCSTPQSFTLLL